MVPDFVRERCSAADASGSVSAVCPNPSRTSGTQVRPVMSDGRHHRQQWPLLHGLVVPQVGDQVAAQ